METTKYLLQDELEIEFEIRSIQNEDKDLNIKELREALELENTKQKCPPRRPHSSASKNPKQELEKCRKKLPSIQLDITWGITAKVPENLLRSKYRLIHIRDRLIRLSNHSPVVQNSALELQEFVENILSSCETAVEQDRREALTEDVVSGLEQLTISDPNLNLGHEILNDVYSENGADIPSRTVTASTGVSSIPTHTVSLPLRYNFPPPCGVYKMSNRTDTFVTSTAESVPSMVSSQLPPKNVTFSTNPSLWPTNVQMRQPHSGVSLQNFSNNPPNIEQPTTSFSYFSNPVVTQTNTPYNQSYISNPSVRKPSFLKNVNITFDGVPNKMPVQRFLNHMEFLAETYSIPSDQLVQEVTFRLAGEALDYYLDILEDYGRVTWETFKILFLKRFRDRRTDDDIKKEIAARKQKPKENFLDFFYAINKLAVSLHTKLTDSQKIKYLMRNMRPSLQIFMSSRIFHSVDDLVDNCRELEEQWNRFGCQPESYFLTRRDISEINYVNQDPVFSCIGSREASAPNVNAIQFRQTPRDVLVVDKNSRDVFPGCWNCASPDHFFKNCNRPVSSIFCFKCGCPNVISPNCIRCQKQKNLKKEVLNLGNNRFRKPHSSPLLVDQAANTDPELYSRINPPKPFR